MFKKLFGKKTKDLEFLMPASGEIRPIEESPDEVFSQKMMGDGFCIMPSEGKIYSPVTGTIASVFPTKHCVGIIDTAGNEWLIHFGMDTVKLNGEGIECFVVSGQSVQAGDLLLSADLQELSAKVESLMTPVILTNLGERAITIDFAGRVEAKAPYAIGIV